LPRKREISKKEKSIRAKARKRGSQQKKRKLRNKFRILTDSEFQ
jgi:hypothetical protein